VGFDYGRGYGKTYARPACVPAPGFVRTVKALKHMGEVLFRYANAGILNADFAAFLPGRIRRLSTTSLARPAVRRL
jgi:hypothetical protein